MKEIKHPAKAKSRKKILLIIFGCFFVILLAFRLYLPTIILKYVNTKLNNIPDYKGHVDDITISLWRGAYQIQGITLNKISGEVPLPFFSAQTMDLSVEWKALFHGSVVAKIIFIHPVVNFVNGPTEAKSQTTIDSSWVKTVKSLVPFKINKFEIKNGEVHFRDFYSTPKVDIFLNNMHAVATNLTNGNHAKGQLPAKVEMETNCFQTGTLHLSMDIDPLAAMPAFELKEEMKGVKLIYLNDFLEAYASFQVKSGEFSLYTEIGAKNGNFLGYTKPFFVNLKVDKSIQENKTIPKEIWANIISAMGWVLKNHPKDQMATEIPIKGSFNKVDIGVWATIGNLLKNAFIEALFPSLDSDVSVVQVGNKPVIVKKQKKNGDY